MEGKQLIQRGADTWNARDQEGFFGLYTDDCELAAPDWVGKGRQGLLEFWSLYMTAFPDNRVVIRRLVEDGGDVVEESIFEGTHTGPMAAPDGTEIPPTGRQVSLPFMGINQIAGDKVASTRFYFDQMAMLTQLGIAGG